MSSIATELAAALATVDRPGDFYASGMTELHTPRLEVEGVGLVALPVLPIQVAQLVAAAERAPYGRGQDTLVDTTVRRTWQIEADRVRIKGRHWAPMLEAVLTRVAEGLGVNGPIEAELYKLLVYDEGSFFVSHRDTEKVPGMFATLVLVLPSTTERYGCSSRVTVTFTESAKGATKTVLRLTRQSGCDNSPHKIAI